MSKENLSNVLRKGKKGKNTGKALEELYGGIGIGSVKINTPEIKTVSEPEPNDTLNTEPDSTKKEYKNMTREERDQINAELTDKINKVKNELYSDKLIQDTIQSEEDAMQYMEARGIKFHSKILGGFIYHTFRRLIRKKDKIKEANNKIPWDTAYFVAKEYHGADAFVSYNPENGLISVVLDDKEKLNKVWEKFKEIIPSFPGPIGNTLLSPKDPEQMQEVREKLTEDVLLEILDMKGKYYRDKIANDEEKTQQVVEPAVSQTIEPEPVAVATPEPGNIVTDDVDESISSAPSMDEGAEDEDSLKTEVKTEPVLKENVEIKRNQEIDTEDPIKALWAKIEKKLDEEIDKSADIAQEKINKRVDDFAKNLEEKFEVQEKKHESLDRKISMVNLNTQEINNIAQKIKDGKTLNAEERAIYEKVPHIIDPMLKTTKQSWASKLKNSWLGKIFTRKGTYVVENINTKENQRTTLDTQVVADKINAKIAELEKDGKVLTPEEKTQVFREVSLIERADFNKKQIESSKFQGIEKEFNNFSKWWIEDLEKNRYGKAFKIGTSAAILGTATYLTGNALNILPAGSSVATRILTRTGIATLIGMAATSNLTKKIFGNPKTEAKSEEVKTGLKKYLTFKNIGMGTSFVISGFLTGGVLAPVAMAGGIALKNFANKKFDNKIKTLDEKVKELEEKIKTQHFDEKLNINNLIKNIDGWRMEREKILNQILNYKWGKNLVNGCVSIGTGLTTLAIAHDHLENIKEINKIENKIENINSNIKSEPLESYKETILPTKIDNTYVDLKTVEANNLKEIIPKTETTSTTYEPSEIKPELPIETKNDNTYVDLKTIDRQNLSEANNTMHPNESDLIQNNDRIEKPIINVPKPPIINPTNPEIPTENNSSTLNESSYVVKEGDGGVSYVVGKLNHNHDALQKVLGDNPSKNKLADFVNKIGAYNPTVKEDSFTIHPGDKFDFKNGDLLIERGGHTYTMAHIDENGNVTKGDWIEKMSDKKFMDTDNYPKNIEKTETTGVDGENFDLTPPEEITPVPEEIKKLETIAPEEIKSINYDSTKNSIDDYVDNKMFRNMLFTEETWAKSPENVYKISFENFKLVDALNKSNIEHLFAENNLTERETMDFKSVLQSTSAESVLSLKINEIDETFLPIWNYMHKLQDITGLKYLTSTPTHPAETTENYIYRALMKASKIGKLDQVKL